MLHSCAHLLVTPGLCSAHSTKGLCTSPVNGGMSLAWQTLFLLNLIANRSHRRTENLWSSCIKTHGLLSSQQRVYPSPEDIAALMVNNDCLPAKRKGSVLSHVMTFSRIGMSKLIKLLQQHSQSLLN